MSKPAPREDLLCFLCEHPFKNLFSSFTIDPNGDIPIHICPGCQAKAVFEAVGRKEQELARGRMEQKKVES